MAFNPAEATTYWAVPDLVVDWKQSSHDLHRAVLAKVILFNGSVILSDSAVISNFFLRSGVSREFGRSDDRFYSDLIERDLLRLAIRTENGAVTPLRRVEESLVKSQGLPSDFPRVTDGRELDFLQDRAGVLQFTLEGAAARYQREIFKLFGTAALSEADVPEDVRKHIVDILAARIADKNEIVKWADFLEGTFLWEDLSKRLGVGDAFSLYGHAVFTAARGPHVTFLPEQLGVNPTYSHEHQVAIDIWRRRTDVEERLISRQRREVPLLSPVDFRDGLVRLTADDIATLRASPERIALDEALRTSAEKLGDFDELFTAMAEYRLLIDSRIVERGIHKAIETQTVSTSVAGLTIGKVAEETALALLCNFLPNLADGLTFGLFSWVHYVQSRSREHRRAKELAAEMEAIAREERERARKAEIDKQLLTRHFIRSASQRIDLAIVSDKATRRDGILGL